MTREELQDFAATTPFTYDEVCASYQLLSTKINSEDGRDKALKALAEAAVCFRIPMTWELYAHTKAFCAVI